MLKKCFFFQKKKISSYSKSNDNKVIQRKIISKLLKLTAGISKIFNNLQFFEIIENLVKFKKKYGKRRISDSTKE